jgi:ribosomal protein S18 acetylase RimI-like enzyme
MLTARPVLIGTWADAAWAIRFYQRHGFRIVPLEEKIQLLKDTEPCPIARLKARSFSLTIDG